MIVRLVKHWNGWRPGQRFTEMPAGAGRLLIRRGLAIRDVEDPGRQRAEKLIRRGLEAAEQHRRGENADE